MVLYETGPNKNDCQHCCAPSDSVIVFLLISATETICDVHSQTSRRKFFSSPQTLTRCLTQHNHPPPTLIIWGIGICSDTGSTTKNLPPPPKNGILSVLDTVSTTMNPPPQYGNSEFCQICMQYQQPPPLSQNTGQFGEQYQQQRSPRPIKYGNFGIRHSFTQGTSPSKKIWEFRILSVLDTGSTAKNSPSKNMGLWEFWTQDQQQNNQKSHSPPPPTKEFFRILSALDTGSTTKNTCDFGMLSVLDTVSTTKTPPPPPHTHKKI